MSTLFGFYGLGLSSLRAAQLGLEIAGDNIANAATPGYTRRRLETRPGIPIPVVGGEIPNGVDIIRVRRQQDALIQGALERERGSLGFAEERLRNLQDVELAFGGLEGNALTTRFSEFSTAFSQLAERAEDPARRRGAIDAAAALATGIRSTYDTLQQQRRDVDQNVRETVTEINRLSSELAELNRRISVSEDPGQATSPLRDQRDQVTEALRELTGATAYTDERGRVQLQFADGGSLVVGETARTLEVTEDADGFARVVASGADVTGNDIGGRLGGLLLTRDTTIPQRQSELDALAVDLIDRTNALTTSGFDLAGNPGTALFEPDPTPATGAAGSIDVSAAIRADVGLLAVSSDGTPGEGSLAQSIADLRESTSATLGGQSPEDYLAVLYASLGQDTANADVQAASSEQLTFSLEQRRDAVSGVNLDEEAVDLIRYQQTYEASARFISVLNDVPGHPRSTSPDNGGSACESATVNWSSDCSPR